jgi:hypothetical protein
LMNNMRTWTKENYPDMDEFRRRRAAQGEQRTAEDDNEFQAEDKRMDKHLMSEDKKLKEFDFNNINNHWMNGGSMPWSTTLTEMQLGKITTWLRMRTPQLTDMRYMVHDEQQLCQPEWELSGKEKGAQTKLYDALAEGYYGALYEKTERGYKFRMDLHSLYGWTPHAEIFKWLKEKVFFDMQLEDFWNIVLHTRGNNNNEHSYKVIYWPEMKMVFIKVARSQEQEKRKRDYNDQRWKKDQTKKANNMELYWEKAASSSTGWEENKWSDNNWGESTRWADCGEDDQEDFEPDYDDDGVMRIQG